MKLNADTTEIAVKDDNVVIEPNYLGYLKSHGYRIEGVKDVKIIPSESRPMGHICAKIETHIYPWGHEKLDVSVHSITLPVCSCEAYKYSKSVDVAETHIADGTVEVCKHLKQAYKELRAESDDQQDTLV